MKLSDSPVAEKKDQPMEIKESHGTARKIIDILNSAGITEEDMIHAALELHVPHPGLGTKEIARKVFKKELDLALSDPNLCILIYAGMLLEEEGQKGNLPDLSKGAYEKDLTYLIIDEVLGMTIAKYISGDKGIFEYVRFDKIKPGILSTLGPFMDDIIAGLIGGVSANMYTRGMSQSRVHISGGTGG